MESAHSFRYVPYAHHHLWTPKGMAMGAAPKILFGFELDHTHAWSQASLAGHHKPNSCNNSGRCLFSLLNPSTNGKSNKRQLPSSASSRSFGTTAPATGSMLCAGLRARAVSSWNVVGMTHQRCGIRYSTVQLFCACRYSLMALAPVISYRRIAQMRLKP